MTIITLPEQFRFARTIEWMLDQPAQVNRSAYTGARQVMGLPGGSRWSARIALKPIIGEENVLAWRSFLAKLRGQQNKFRLRATEAQQHIGGVNMLVNGAGQTGTVLNVDGLALSTTVMKAGRFITLNDQLHLLTNDVVTDSLGQAQITFEPGMRVSPADNTAIETRWPTCLVALTSPVVGWSVEPGQIYGMQLEVEEAY